MSNIPKKFTAEKTTFIHVGTATVPVSSFPSKILSEFEVLDSMKQDAGNLAYQLEVITLAIKAKTNELATEIAEYYKEKTPAPVAPTVPVVETDV